MSTSITNLSFISPPEIFPSSSVFTSLDYLFGGFQRRLIQIVFHGLCGIYGRIEMKKNYTNKNGNPQEILRKAKVEGTLWAEAQLLVPEPHGYSQPDVNWQTMRSPESTMSMGHGGNKIFSPDMVGTAGKWIRRT